MGHMESKRQTLGQTFKDKREEKELSLREIENATSIRMNFLEAIEEGTISSLISPVYAQGFIRQYASYLGMDGDDLLKKNPDFLLQTKPKAQNFAYGIGTLEMRNSPGVGARGGGNAIWIAAFLGVVFVAWLLARYLEVF